MTIYDTEFSKAIDNAIADLGGSTYHDHETGGVYNFPAKDTTKYASAYQYSFESLHKLMTIVDTIQEIKLIKLQIQFSQDFALQHTEFSTDFILNFSYKNWVIRINILAEQLIYLVNHVYRLNLPDKDLVNQIFEHPKVKADKILYFALLDLVDFLHQKILLKVSSKTLKKARNEIVHKANFKHDTIHNLSLTLAEFKFGISDHQDDEDIYLEEGQASEKVKKEILDFSNQFLNKLLSLLSQFTGEFEKNFKSLTH